MPHLDAVLVTFAFAIATYGVLALLATWCFPSWLASPLFSNFMLTGRMEPTRTNRTLMATWSLLFGAYIALSTAGLRALSHVTLALCISVAMAIITQQFKGRR